MFRNTTPGGAGIFRAGIVGLLLCATGSPAKSPPLRVGVGATRPTSYLDADGKPRGFIVEALTEAARREGIALEWKSASTIPANNAALSAGELDLIVGPPSEERRRLFWVSDPWWTSELIALVRKERGLHEESHLRGLNLVTQQSAVALISSSFPENRVDAAANSTTAAEAVCQERADGAVLAAMYLRELLQSPPPACQGIGLTVIDIRPQIEYNLIARPARREDAERLRARLDEIIADGTLAGIALRNPPISTPQATRMGEILRARFERRTFGLGLVAGATVLLLLLLVAFWQYQSRLKLRTLNERLEGRVAALHQSEERFRTLLATAPQAVFLIDRDGVIRYANARSSTIFDLPPEKLLGAPFQRLVPEWTTAGLPGQKAWRAKRSSGSGFPAEISIGEVLLEGGQLTLVFVADISERVAIESRARESQRLESIGQLAGGVAHDFNNLLTVMQGYAELLKDKWSRTGDPIEPVDEILRATDRATRLTRQLLSFSKRQPTVLRPLDLNHLVGDAQRMLRRLIPSEIEFQFHPAPEPAPVVADPAQIEQVLMNLIINARDAMHGGGRMTVEIRSVALEHDDDGVPAGSYELLRVTDTGTGIPLEVRPKIFEPFFTTKEQGKGTGLGLATVYAIVTQSGGFIQVESEVGKGTTFAILLPRTKEHVEARAAERKSVTAGGSETILVAEDDPAIRQLVTTVLQMNGYHVLAAGDGEAALELAHRHEGEILLLLTDSVMPRMGGEELSRNFAARYPAARILHMSGYNERLDPSLDQNLLAKPFSPAQLTASVRAALDAPPD